jgi:hypothetical protein
MYMGRCIILCRLGKLLSRARLSALSFLLLQHIYSNLKVSLLEAIRCVRSSMDTILAWAIGSRQKIDRYECCNSCRRVDVFETQHTTKA